MRYLLSTETIDGVDFVAGYRLTSERGVPSSRNEVSKPPDGELRLPDGRYRYALTDRGIVEREQPETADLSKVKAERTRDEKIAALVSMVDIVRMMIDMKNLEFDKLTARVAKIETEVEKIDQEYTNKIVADIERFR
jgi:hypothetical protein